MAWGFVKIIPFRSLPRGARRLITYYSIGEPSTVGMIIFNAYLFLLGYSPVYVGSIISGAALITALLLPLLGYLSDKKINAKYYVMTLETLLGLSFIIYGLASSELWIFIGRVIFSTAMLFSFASNVYERELYPRDKLEDAYIWHWLIPSVAGIVTYIGAFIYFSLVPNIQYARIFYVAIGLLAPIFIAYVYFALPDMPTYPERSKIKIPQGLVGVVLVYLGAYFTTYFLYGIAIDNIIINYFGSGLAIIVILALIDSVFGFSSSIMKAHISKKYFHYMPYISMMSIGVTSLLIFVIHLLGVESLWSFVILYSFIAFMWPLWHMSFKPLLQRRIPKEYRGTIFSSIQSLIRFINIPLAFIVGTIIVLWGSFSPLLISSFFAVLTVTTLKILVS